MRQKEITTVPSRPARPLLLAFWSSCLRSVCDPGSLTLGLKANRPALLHRSDRKDCACSLLPDTGGPFFNLEKSLTGLRTRLSSQLQGSDQGPWHRLEGDLMGQSWDNQSTSPKMMKQTQWMKKPHTNKPKKKQQSSLLCVFTS